MTEHDETPNSAEYWMPRVLAVAADPHGPSLIEEVTVYLEIDEPDDPS